MLGRYGGFISRCHGVIFQNSRKFEREAEDGDDLRDDKGFTFRRDRECVRVCACIELFV